MDQEIEARKSQGYSPTLPVDEQRYRIDQVREAMQKRNLDAVLFFGSGNVTPDHIRYLTGYSHILPRSHSFLIVPKNRDPIFIIDRTWHSDEAREMSWIDDIRMLPRGSMAVSEKELKDMFTAVFQDSGLVDSTIGVFERSMPAIYLKTIEKNFDSLNPVDVGSLWNDIVTSPSDYGIEIMGDSARIADRGLQTIIENCEAGQRESEVCLEAINEMASMGAEFCIPPRTMAVIGSNSNGCYNLKPFTFTSNRIRDGQMFWYDQITAYSGFFIDCDRTISVGEPTEKQSEIYEVVRTMYEEMKANLTPGIRGENLWKIGYEVADREGYGEFINSVHLGHTIGPSVVGRTVAAKGIDYQVEEGSFVNIEPGVFVPGVGSACIENPLYVTEDGAEPILQTDIGLAIV